MAAPIQDATHRAGFGLRLEACLIDYMLSLLGAVAIIWAGSLLVHHMSLTALSLAGLGGMGLVFLFNHVWLGTLTGQSVGKMILAIRAVRTDGRPLEWSRMLGRSTVGYLLSAAVFGLGFIWILWDPEQQAWHDKIFSTYVVRMR
ncbi:MAG: RDD family protein [Acidobacteria bacterium]|nr:RDD family protein [Acidobacteriota bacterium]